MTTSRLLLEKANQTSPSAQFQKSVKDLGQLVPTMRETMLLSNMKMVVGMKASKVME